MSPKAPAPHVFDVHLFPVVRLKISGVQAASHVEAIERALEQVEPELEGRCARAGVEYAEEISHYLVDVVGDPDFSQSRFYAAEDPLLAFLRRLVAWEECGRAPSGLDELIADVRAHLTCVV